MLQSVTMLLSNVEGMTTTSRFLRGQKGSASKVQIPYPDVFKIYIQVTGEVDSVNKRTAACNLDRKLSIHFYFRILFNLMNLACTNIFTVYNMMHPDIILSLSNTYNIYPILTLLYFKTIVSTHLAGCYTSSTKAH